MGHDTGLTEAYRRPSIEMLAEFHASIEHLLTLTSDRASVAKLKTKAVHGEKEIEEIRREMAELKARLALLILKENE